MLIFVDIFFMIFLHFGNYLLKVIDFRAIDWLSLVGNIGGYVGMCLGYSLLQLPNLLRQLIDVIRSRIDILRQKTTSGTE